MIFDPKTVTRYMQGSDYRMLEAEEGDIAEFVKSSDYDALLSLYGAERQSHRDDIRDMQREMRDVAAEARWAERQGEDHGSY